MESAESRYAHLLQPIRELTKNWDIDVASELNDYLDELDEMCITFDGGKTRLNFAEAALLIQGSTCIYSKKVELLHSLVYQTLDYINDKNRKQNKQAAASQGGDAATRSHNEDQDEAEFSPLDIDVSEDAEVNSSMAIKVVPLPPEGLIALDTHEKQSLPLISVKGEVLCSQKDFRINLFFPGPEDLILLTRRSTTSNLPLMDDEQQPVFVDTEALMGGVGMVEAADGGGDAGDGFLPVEDHEMELDPEEHVLRQQALRSSQRVLERRRVDNDKARTGQVNVWKLHDPYAVLGGDKPFKSGKCYKVPDGLDDGGKRKRKHASALQDFGTWFRGISDPPEHKLKNGPTFTDLNYVYLSTMKSRLRTRKRLFRRAGVVVSDEELRRTFLQPEEAGSREQGEEPVNLLGADEDNSDGEHEGFPDHDADDLVGGPEAADTQLGYEDLVKLRVEQLVVSCRGYTQETALSRRVKDWEDKIRPELELQEERPLFDIHDYGNRIVSALTSVGQRRSFASLVCGLDNIEACKFLLASLQLANDYTVELDSAGGLEESLDSMGLTLLSTHRATDRFLTLTAS
ncbi:condensin-2 complex subunit H2 isoform 2-T2 [Aulostomus maculatus]